MVSRDTADPASLRLGPKQPCTLACPQMGVSWWRSTTSRLASCLVGSSVPEQAPALRMGPDHSPVRKRRGKTTLGAYSEWEYLLGEPPQKWSPDAGTLKESSQNVGASWCVCTELCEYA